MHSRIARPLRLGALAFASALALSACEEQPVGSFKNAEFVNEGSRAKTDLYFQPGGSALRPGEAGRLHSFLSTQLLSPETDIESWAPAQANKIDTKVLEWLAGQMRGKRRINHRLTALVASLIGAAALPLAQLPGMLDMGML
jgi:hypothetical protein